MNRPRLEVCRQDGRYLVRATDWELEHTHRHRFPGTPEGKGRARRLAERIESALEHGGDLDLRFWDYSGPAVVEEQERAY